VRTGHGGRIRHDLADVHGEFGHIVRQVQGSKMVMAAGVIPQALAAPDQDAAVGAGRGLLTRT
jgi:hypothetical protein